MVTQRDSKGLALIRSASQVEHTELDTFRLDDMTFAALEQTLPDERLTQQEFDVLLSPLLGG